MFDRIDDHFAGVSLLRHMVDGHPLPALSSRMAFPVWLPVTISSVSVCIALSAFLYQVWRARFNQSIDLLFRLEADFFGNNKRAQRVKAATGLLQGDTLEAEPILDFFETIALLLRRGALDKEIVWHTFFYWIDNYYEVTKDVIALRQQANPVVWRDLSNMVETLRKYQAEKVSPRTFRPPSSEQAARFLMEEQTEAQ